MKQIIFHSVSIKNFLSVGNDTVTVEFNKGFHVITGLNKDKVIDVMVLVKVL